jgi:hypothetical protein
MKSVLVCSLIIFNYIDFLRKGSVIKLIKFRYRKNYIQALKYFRLENLLKKVNFKNKILEKYLFLVKCNFF